MKRRRLKEHATGATARSASSTSSTNGEGRTVTLLRDIQSGQANVRTIAIEDRRLIVAYLAGDGYSSAEIAQMLKVSDRSIERDKRAIREGNALPRDPRLLEQMTGRLLSEAELTIQRIRRVTRDKAAPPAVKVDGEHRCYQVASDLVQRLQGLGYLPSATHRIEAELLHHTEHVPSLDELGAQLAALSAIASDSEGEALQQLTELQAEVQRASIAVRVQRLDTRVRAGHSNRETTNDAG